MQSVSSRIWTRVAVSITSDDNHYTTGTSRLYGDRDETTNRIISECSKLVQKEYNTRYYRVAKVIHRELCKKFDHTNKLYMLNPVIVLEKEMQTPVQF